jgi:hypothetical protein
VSVRHLSPSVQLSESEQQVPRQFGAPLSMPRIGTAIALISGTVTFCEKACSMSPVVIRSTLIALVSTALTVLMTAAATSIDLVHGLAGMAA